VILVDFEPQTHRSVVADFAIPLPAQYLSERSSKALRRLERLRKERAQHWGEDRLGFTRRCVRLWDRVRDELDPVRKLNRADWQANHRERRREIERSYYDRDPERRRAQWRAYRNRNLARVRAAQRVTAQRRRVLKRQRRTA
jgi:hypothetical protein